MSNKPNPADQLAIAESAKQHFLKDFQGAKIVLPTSFYHPQVIRAFKRTFYPVVKNWWLVTSLSPKLKDKSQRTVLATAMLAKVDDTLNKIKRLEQQLEALMVSASLTMDILQNGKPFSDPVTLQGPVSIKFREVLMGCDRLLNRATLLYTMAELDQAGFDDVRDQVEKFMKGIDTSLRNHRIKVMDALNAEGAHRPGYKKGEGEGNIGPADAVAAGDAKSDATPAAEVETPADAAPTAEAGTPAETVAAAA